MQATRATAAEKLRFYRQLLWIAEERRYKPGWAAHKFKEKFGTWPPLAVRDAAPTEPEHTRMGSVAQIAYAKAIERAPDEGETMDRAAGRWKEILPRFGIDRSYLTESPRALPPLRRKGSLPVRR